LVARTPRVCDAGSVPGCQRLFLLSFAAPGDGWTLGRRRLLVLGLLMNPSDEPAPRSRPLQMVILRKVKAGREAEFEMQVASFFKAAANMPGVCGAHLISPVAGSDHNEYGILRSFSGEEEMRAFYASALYQQWQRAVQPLVDGEPRIERLHGMEGFFRSLKPPRWKMAVLTWFAVNLAVYLFSTVISSWAPVLPATVAFLLTNALVVAALTWALMPALTHLFHKWLTNESRRNSHE